MKQIQLASILDFKFRFWYLLCLCFKSIWTSFPCLSHAHYVLMTIPWNNSCKIFSPASDKDPWIGVMIIMAVLNFVFNSVFISLTWQIGRFFFWALTRLFFFPSKFWLFLLGILELVLSSKWFSCLIWPQLLSSPLWYFSVSTQDRKGSGYREWTSNGSIVGTFISEWLIYITGCPTDTTYKKKKKITWISLPTTLLVDRDRFCWVECGTYNRKQ